ncbi:hypothetical protein BJY52DRAFT_1217340 [Lactarius psammicola]|nr:hypothetical protein BJY52DRAFT_1217340 [Lactarius psammicola]
MSQTLATTTASSRFQAIFHAALKSYQKQTKKDLLAHPLSSQLQSCDSTSAILAVLQDQVREFDGSRSGDGRLTRWLVPTVNVLYAFSAAVSEGVGLVFSPGKVIFAGIGVFLLAAKDVAASKDALAELFERMEFFFKRLETYTEITPTAAMTDIITEIMVEVLTIFGIATKELRRGPAKKFLKKLAGRTDLEDALKKLDRLTQEEARMALSEVLRVTHSVRDEVKVVDGKVVIVDDKVEDVGDKVGDIGNKVEDIGDKVEDIGDKVEGIGDKVECVDEKVQVVIDDGKEAKVAAKEAKIVIQQTANSVDEIKWNQLKQLLRTWLSPADPSTNHNIARKAQHKGTAVWFFQDSIFVEWKSTGSLLWIHGKPGSGKSVICSSVIQDIMATCEAGLAIMSYFYFDFRDLNKQSCHDLLLSLVSQLSTRSSHFCDILYRVYKTHENGTRQPSDDTLKECLKEMLRLPGQGPIFIVLDALDECPDSSGIPSPRSEVLQLVKELVDLRLQELHICATSRPEVDIRAVLDPLAFRSVSLHNESGQKTDIADYIRSVVNSSLSTAMRRWRADDKSLVIETLTDRADGMFRWVFCQLDTLQHCFPPNLRQFLNELPETLDETYKRILRGINKAQRDNARRLLQCLAVAVRPLRVEELAELLAFDFQTSSSGGIPKLKEDWRWDDQEEAVLSTCSSLISIVPDGDSRVVQFSHFSVKEYLTSPRLAQSHGDVSWFHIDLEPAHTILAQACLGTLLRLDEHASNSGVEVFPLVKYAAEHWVDHAQFEKVSLRVRDGMDDLFDNSKPHFAAWLQVHNLDKHWLTFSRGAPHVGSPLYYAAFCGFYDLAERLIMKHPEQVNAGGGRNLPPLVAALYNRHFHVANLLHKHGALVDVRGQAVRTPLHAASIYGHVDIIRWLLNHGADPNARKNDRRTPLHLAAFNMKLEAVQVLLDHNADVNSGTDEGKTPLYETISYLSHPEGQKVDVVQRLLEHGADPNATDHHYSTPLHQASSEGLPEKSINTTKYVRRHTLRRKAAFDDEKRDPHTDHVSHNLATVTRDRGAEDALGDNESPHKRSAAFATFTVDAQEDVFEAFEVIMIEPASGRTGNLQALLVAKLMPRSVGNNIDVATLCKGRDHGNHPPHNLVGFAAVATPVMSQTPTTATASSRFQAIFHAALKSYQKQTKKDLLAHPLSSQLQSCDLTSAILAVLQDQIREFDGSRSGDGRLTRWLVPTVNVLYAFSAAVSEGVGLVFSPGKVIFAGIGVFLLAAKDVAASKDALAELFERMEFFFKRLETYTEITPTAAMTDIITEIMVAVLTIFGIATKELRRGPAKKFLKKLAGRTDLEDALKKLDRLTQEEARMALSEVLRVTHSVRDEVKVVDGKVMVVDDKVEDVGDKVGDIGNKVEGIGDKVECVDEKVQVVIDDGKAARVAAEEAKIVIQQTANSVDEIKWNQLKQLLRTWLSPADPSTNHNIARKAQHKGTAVWFFQDSIFVEWKSTGSLLWIHGKPGSGKSVICSSVIQDIMATCEAGSAIMAYFYFDFRDLNKQSCHDLLLSLVSQLSTRSSHFCDILHRVYKTHEDGTRQPSDDTLKECLKEMLRLPGQCPIFIVLDALDECPDSSGIPSPRSEVLQLVKELVDLRLQELHICATSRPEVDIRAVLDPLAFRSVSLHNESGQKTDIADYVRSVVNSSLSTAMRRWRADDKNLVIETLTGRADGMFRWVFCQLDTLQHCFPPNLRQFLNELPETLDETYKRILRGINKAQRDNARRLLQCLAVAVRPLRVEELAELLAFDFQTSSSGGIPKLKEDWRWDDQEEAVLSTCSSLISIVPDGYSRVVQFSHFSVKEYLTSLRLAQSQDDVSQFYIDLDPAHTIMVQACLATLLQLDEHAGNSGGEGFPLVRYAARHWVDHAEFEKVSSRVRDGMDDLFDNSKPHFAAWLRMHDMDEDWEDFTFQQRRSHHGSPLYYAAFCGFYDLAERLIMKHPEQVNAGGGRILAPLPAALYKRRFRVANLLHKHGAVVDVRGDSVRTPLHVASIYGHVDIIRWLLNHGADPNARKNDRRTPLHLAAFNTELEAVQVLLEYNADVNSGTKKGKTPLYETISYLQRPEEKKVGVVQRLLEHGADPNASDHDHSTPLHQASSEGLPEVTRVLLSYGAKVDEKDGEGRTPFQVASSKGHDKITKLLLEHGAVPQP